MPNDYGSKASRYRLRFLTDVFKNLVIPAASLRLVLWWSDIQLPLYQLLPLYPAFIAAWTIINAQLTAFQQSREARSLNARQIPRVVGKWPGNLDILLRMMNAFKTSYVAQVYLQLFEEYRCTTLNLRILWNDTVSSRHFWIPTDQMRD
ncbi:hypothetical protein NMY22_g446 [Coprinellus aureogranulatus]|nr:hypothetical protein NMY22_g446 [Coprinellus aureogranulatus]